MLFNLGNDGRRERDAIETLAAYQVEGFILNTLGRGARRPRPARHGKPAGAGRPPPRRHARRLRVARQRGAVRTACGHLLDEGWRELLYVTEPLAGVSSRQERAAAFRACMTAHEPRVARRQSSNRTGDDGDALDDACAPCTRAGAAAAPRCWRATR